VALEERDRPAQEPNRGAGLLVAEHFGVGQAGRVVDRDVHELPAGVADASPIRGIGRASRPLLAVAGDAMAGHGDAPKLLDVDMDQLARPLALIALRRLKPEAPELAHPQPLADRADRRQRNAQQLAELRRREAQPPQRRDQLLGLNTGPIGNKLGRRRAIQQSCLALGPPTGKPLASGSLGHPRRLCGPLDRPTIPLNSIDQQPATDRAEPRVSVNSHPASPWCWGFEPPASKEARMNNIPRNYT
jgi:hypothetical protein